MERLSDVGSSWAMSQGGKHSSMPLTYTGIYTRGRMEGTFVLLQVTELKEKEAAILHSLHSAALHMFMIACAVALWMALPEEVSRLLLHRMVCACCCRVHRSALVVSIHTLQAVLKAMSTKEVWTGCG
jgi:hypothetical protein